VILACELAVCAALAVRTWAWTEVADDPQNVTATFNGTSIMWSGAVVDSDGVASFDLFAQSYVDSGVVAAQTDDKSAIIAPGTSADTCVTFTNVSDSAVTIRSEVWRTAKVTLASDDAYDIEAFEREIFSSDAFAEGVVSVDTYDGEVSASDVKRVYAVEQAVAAGESVTGKITWGWPLDGYDADDTFYGNAAADDKPIKVTVSLDIEVVDDSAGEVSVESARGMWGLTQTGDAAPVIALAAASAATLCVLAWLLRRRDRS
jgi:hypothetical protein